jgi:AcrR family transcriptional regulator
MTTSSRGRPRTTSREELEAVAISLFRARGFAATTVPMIADAGGVGRSTVFRYWASKSDIVWGEFERHLERLTVTLEATDVTSPPIRAAADAVVSTLEASIAATPNWLDRFELIDASPDLAAHSAGMWARWTEIVSTHLAVRVDADRDDPRVRGAAAAMQGAFVAVLRLWERDSDESRSVRDALDEAFDTMCEHVEPWLGS